MKNSYQSPIDELKTLYGDRLQSLTITEKLALLSVASAFLGAVSGRDEAVPSLRDYACSLPVETPVSGRVFEIIRTLDQCRNESLLKQLLQLLTAQICETPIVWNAATYQETLNSLTASGVKELSAKRAARIAASGHPSLIKTEREKVAIAEALGQLNCCLKRSPSAAEVTELAPVQGNNDATELLQAG